MLPFNIIPVDQEAFDEYTKHLPEIRAVIDALHNSTGLEICSPEIHAHTSDILDWMGYRFGFQKDNIANQREHIVLLLGNAQMRLIPKPEQPYMLDDRAVDTVMMKLFENYNKWCKHVGCESNLRLPNIQQNAQQQRKLLYMGLYFLIWGEASNVRHMPECICYVFHQMASELCRMLVVNSTGAGSATAAYGDEEHGFLNKVVTPLYRVIEKEAERGKTINSKHSKWRNYDDLNEFFWSNKCFRLGWPMNMNDNFFSTCLDGEDRTKWIGKSSFVESRSFLHIFHSFERMWIFLILSLQALIIVAWHCDTPNDLSEIGVLTRVSSIFITASAWRFGQGLLDIGFTWKARRSMLFSAKLRQLLKLISALAWFFMLLVTYTYLWENPIDLAKTIKSWLGIGQYHPWLYISNVVMYLVPNMLGFMFFCFPNLRILLERSNFKVIKFMLWFSQPQSFIGEGMHEGLFWYLMYTLFWSFIFTVKFTVSYTIGIKPLVKPTRYLSREEIGTFQWHEFFPRSNIGPIVTLWAPTLMVYFMDIQVWYAIVSAVIGYFHGIYLHVGEIRTLELLKSRFKYLPEAVNKRLDSHDSVKINGSLENKQETQKIYAKFSIIWNAIITSLRLEDLLNDKETDLLRVPNYQGDAFEVPTNSEARRRLLFFANSMLMHMPNAPTVRNMPSFSILTPYFREDVRFSSEDIGKRNEDGVTTLFYLQKVFPDEWKNFLERVQCEDVEEIRQKKLDEELYVWASYRSQTLIRTVRGMDYYRKALELLAFLDTNNDIELMDGYRADETKYKAVTDLKYTHVVSAQEYGRDKNSHNPRAEQILRLMHTFPSLRIAYIDEVLSKDSKGKDQKIYYSTLAKASPTGLDQVIYKIKLPGNAILGEGKPENQNHAVIFTRGECLQTIDMNQEHYLEEAFKIRNLLQEFDERNGSRNPSIIGVRETIFTGSVSSLARFMSNQESSFMTLAQRVLSKPLRIRMHYGHPDIFDRIFHITRGGVSKASKSIHISEDIFAGFNSTLRGGNVTYCEYVQIGKGRDVGLNQITLFEAKVASGNGEQSLTRDVYRLGKNLDFFRMFSFYITTIGFYFNAMITVWALYAFIYGHLYLVLSGIDESLASGTNFIHNGPLQMSLSSPCLIQLGFFTVLPMMSELWLERGLLRALAEFLSMQLHLATMFFTFSIGTKVHHYGTTLLHGGAKYRAPGRGFVLLHAKFTENYMLYSRSHFVKGTEMMTILFVDLILGHPYRRNLMNYLITIFIWFLAVSWCFAPFVFNPSGFDWDKTVRDWADWRRWMNNAAGIGVKQEESWLLWWRELQVPVRHTGKRGTVMELLLASRFFIYQYGLVYHLEVTKNLTNNNRSVLVYLTSFLILLISLVIMKAVSSSRRRSSPKYQRSLRVMKGVLFASLLGIAVLLKAMFGMTILDFVLCIIGFTQTTWGMLLIAQATPTLFEKLRLWKLIEDLARGYESLTGGLIFFFVAVVSWFPFISGRQNRVLFNQPFSRGLEISHIIHHMDE